MSIFTPQKRVAVFRGGEQATNRRSMESGAVIIDTLKATRGYTPVDVVLSPSGEWLVEGRAVAANQLLSTVDAGLVAVLGRYGEDGQLARELERNGIPHTAASPYAALETWQKNLATERLQQYGIKTPRRVVVQAHSNGDWHTLAAKLQDLFGPTYVVKPLHGTQHQHVHRTSQAADVPRLITSVLSEHPACLIEEYITGQPLTVASVPGLRNQALYHTPCARYDHQFSDDGQLTADSVLGEAFLSRTQREAVFDTLSATYRHLNLRGAIRTDLQVTPAGDVYVIEVNTVSPLTADSAFSFLLQSVGITTEEFLLQQLAS